MSRVTSGKVTHTRHKKVIKNAKGYYGCLLYTSPSPRDS